MPGYGTETAMVSLEADMCLEIDRKDVTFLILLELSVAFDRTDCEIFLDNHSQLGVEVTLLWWFQSYLKGMFQGLTLGDCCAKQVLRDSMSCPTFFSISVKSLVKSRSLS